MQILPRGPIIMDHEQEHFKTLTGQYKHYCPDWDYMAIDEYSPEFDACTCAFPSQGPLVQK